MQGFFITPQSIYMRKINAITLNYSDTLPKVEEKNIEDITINDIRFESIQALRAADLVIFSCPKGEVILKNTGRAGGIVWSPVHSEMRDRILKRISELRVQFNGFTGSHFDIWLGEKHVSNLDFDKIPDPELLMVYENIVNRASK